MGCWPFFAIIKTWSEAINTISTRLDKIAYKMRHLLPARIRRKLLNRRFTPATDLISIRTLGLSQQLVFPGRRTPLYDIQSYSNLSPELAATWEHSYRPRDAMVEDISIIRLPPDTRVSGALGFAVMADGFMVTEQQVAIDAAMLPHLAYGFRAQEASVRISEDAMLIARYGEGTWGHWLAELLPKIAVCERVSPGRFRYVMADYVLQDQVMGARVRESCAAYGVSADRFIRVPKGQQYSFDRLYAMTPVVSDGTLHPEVREILNEDVEREAFDHAGPICLNLLRNDGHRSLVNAEIVNCELSRRGFGAFDLAALPFKQQVAAFRRATSLFSVLGSGLTGLVYSPAEVRVVAAAPAEWADDFFYGILRTSPKARWAEVRGPIVDRHPHHLRLSSFRLDQGILSKALDSIAF